MTTECPVSLERVDERAARAGALLVLGVTFAILLTPFSFLAAALAVDFFLRAFVSPKLSPIGWAARAIVRRLGLTPRPTDAAPKRFAAGLGFAFSAAGFGLTLAGLETAGALVFWMLGGCAALEGLLGYCLGCQVYTLVKPLLPKPRIAVAAPDGQG